MLRIGMAQKHTPCGFAQGCGKSEGSPVDRSLPGSYIILYGITAAFSGHSGRSGGLILLLLCEIAEAGGEMEGKMVKLHRMIVKKV